MVMSRTAALKLPHGGDQLGGTDRAITGHELGSMDPSCGNDDAVSRVFVVPGQHRGTCRNFWLDAQATNAVIAESLMDPDLYIAVES